MQIEGQVAIKRKTEWVTRYAQIRESVFQYKKDKYDIKARFITDLRQTTVKKGKLEPGKGYFEIRDKIDPKSDVIRIAFTTQEEYRRWGLVFMESVKSDTQLRQERQSVIDKEQQRQAEEQRRLEEATELESRVTRAKSVRIDIKKQQIALYCGRYTQSSAIKATSQ